MKRLEIAVWSDVVCPWCYLGKRRLEKALGRFPDRDGVAVRWRAFELDPRAPRVRDANTSYAQRLAAKYETSVERADAMIRTMTETGAAEGLDFRFDIAQSGNTFDAHRLIHMAGQRDLADQAEERVFRAYFTEGLAIGEHEVLVELAGDIGLDRDEARAVLAGGDFAAEVRRDEEEARQLGIRGVPFFAVGGRGVSGAQPPDALLQMLDAAWRALPEAAQAEAGPGRRG